ncbi:MAG: hypothetical protein GY705_21480 [Bacteroidetes bacterium]|nr:hypothetical protein [Bacteroidota bacterium]
MLIYILINQGNIDKPKPSSIKVPEVKDTWALWAGDNLEGKVALVSGGDILRMAQHYKKPAENLVPNDFCMVQEKINRIRPGNYKSLGQALTYFREDEVRYVITDHVTLNIMRKRLYLKEIQSKKWGNTFIPVKSFPAGKPGSALIGVNIYKIGRE